MNTGDNERFHELAHKALAKRATQPKQWELRALIAENPKLKEEMEHLGGEAGVIRELLPLLADLQQHPRVIPHALMDRLRTEVGEELVRRCSRTPSNESRASNQQVQPENQMSDDIIRQREFTGAMLDIYRRALTEAHYRASHFCNMVYEQGGHQAAMTLIHSAQPSDGYTALWKLKRLDLTVEALLLRPHWHDLFTDDDRRAAYRRLTSYEFQFPADSWHPPA